ncbi:Mov34/MPN/PAD-1 family protein [Stappia indica]|uniref:Mov34/MPN/PAD-1 family protein n=1 Tax=Stappia indica TaxID=538381 RepID=UPI003969E5E7|nr:Mov34/MPN/PAD-1 family protein [Stappia indica]
MIHELLQRTRSCRSGIEQGGLLLGLRKENALQITSYTLPQKWDYATPVLFNRHVRGHRELAQEEWRRSGKTVDWLGEWHTHPRGVALPSMTDRQSWLHLARHTKNPMVFLIFSGCSIYAGLQQVAPTSFRQLSQIERNEEAVLLG